MKRKGSALLIVLGVLAFLVVSAVAFSAYMRRSRLPSSYLRRSVAARELAKGALARAIDEIDQAIANGVHPGIGGTSQNTWRDRVFFRGGAEQHISQTAPTLTFEGLAYIPPPLVNEARYWSRKTPTAVWSSFGYDTGRYAYCALDVSDYLDVNRLVADFPRSSAANRRITIAHLFEDVNHTSAPSGADAWDKFMEAFRDVDDESLDISFDSSSKMPLVSIADFNLALGHHGSIGKMKSPFVEYLNAGTGSFYPGDGSAQDEAYAAMTFVTDGWFPRSKKTVAEGAADGANAIELHDLADGRYQPYQTMLLQKNGMKLSQAVLGTALNKAGGISDVWLERLSGLGCAALADYLDADRTPISLSIPTTERVPMICGISPQLGNALFKVTCEGADKEPTEKSKEGELKRTVEQTVTWKIDAAEIRKAFMQGRVQALAVYPFLHKEESEPTFKVDGQLSLFFSSPDLGLRTGPRDALHLAQSQIQPSVIDPANGIISVKLDTATPNMKTLSSGIADTAADAVWDSGVTMSLQQGSALATELNNAGRELLKVTYTWTQTRSDEDQPWTPSTQELMGKDVSNDGSVQVIASCGLPALTAIGTVDEDFTARLVQNIKNPNWSKEIRLNVAVWLRVINTQDNKIVDLVPACINDDKTQNGITDPDERVQVIGQDEFAGKPYPLMRFDTGVKFSFGVKKLSEYVENNSAGVQFDIQPKSAMIGDPRFNYAPEHWFSFNSDNLTPEEWLKNCYAPGVDDANRDIFLATSDAGYLQSVYELAFLPRFTNLRTFGNSPSCGNLQRLGSAGFTSIVEKGRELNKGFMWSFYDPFGDDRDAFNELPLTSEGTGMKVNPYSNSTNVLLAAFANTPVDWRRAHTNFEFNAALDAVADDVKAFNQKYAWNEYTSSEGCAFAWGDLEKIAGKFMDRMRSSGNTGWKRVWNDLWDDGANNDASDELLGVKLSTETDRIWDVDRRFLYGFWSDCFAAKQQLFLIFIRAEPLLLGGGTADQLPPQLGARAVAVVWRDPETSSKTENGYPHRTRILFYRPLD